MVLKGHDNAVTGAAVSRNHGLLVTVGRDRCIVVWRQDTWQEVHRKTAAHDDWINDVALDQDVVATASNDFRIKLWTLLPDGSLAPLRSLVGHVGAVVGLALRSNTVYSCSFDGTARVWSVNGGELCVITSEGDRVNSVACMAAAASGGVCMAVCTEGGRVRLYDPRAADLRTTLTGHANTVTKVRLGGARLVSGSIDGSAKVWDHTRATVVPTHTGAVSAILQLLPGDVAAGKAMAALVTADTSGDLTFWHPATDGRGYSQLHTIHGAHKVC